ncbi:YbfB/YjiJ family MFS transporter [Cupriavidus necator]|uniref:YbfB/YjiJ family MFS transporter n=1 Tax=Cupriavidus necator TaxID=106590 RepID=UPI00278A2451|nr:YbfB/YjiJ family MFS transporter [Cupriavidus necator]MDQ0138732.1 putative MFS family arabinose efflux permease [Cupriavidus necator]
MSRPLSAPRPCAIAAAPLSLRDLYAAFSGLCASLVAIGLARFAYTALVPPLIQAHWFPAGQTVALGAANFAGYLAGALLGRPLVSVWSNRAVLRALMLAATVAFFACAWPLSVAWFFAWRFISGVAGGGIMVLVATSILPHIPAPRRGLAMGTIFVGLGLGIAASGTLVPRLLQFGLRETWLGLGALALVLTALSWFGWPGQLPQSAGSTGTTPNPSMSIAPATRRRLRVLYAQYAINAIGLVPAMMLLVDLVARGLGRGSSVGASYWVLYGIGAIAGPMACGLAGDRLGFGATYRGALLLQGLATAVLALSGHPVALGVAAVVLGAFTPGIAPLGLGRIQELLPHDPAAQRAAWSHATSAFALFQALAGYGYAWMFAHSHENYALIFGCGAVAVALALAVGSLAERRTGR